MNDQEFDDRLRAGLHDVAGAAGEPPVWPDTLATTPSSDTGRPLWQRALTAAAVLAVVIGGLALVERRGGDGVADETPSSAPLFGTRWYLSSATLDGAAVDVTPGRVPWVFGEENPCTFSGTDCVAGPMLLGRDGCNQFERSISVDGDQVTWGEYNLSTAMACQGQLQTAFDELARSDGFTFTTSGDMLRVWGSGVELTFRAGDPLGDPSGFVLDEGRIGDIAYRVTWQAGVAIEWVDTSTTSMINTQGYAATGDTLSGNFVDFGGSRYLFAILPDAAASAAYVLDDGDTLPLTMLDHDGAPIVAASRLFDSDPGPGLLTVLDATGTVLASIPMAGADQPGLTSLPPTVTTAPVATTAPTVSDVSTSPTPTPTATSLADSDDVVVDDPLGPGSWSGARTSADGNSLVLLFVGAADYQVGDPCTMRYVTSVEESDTDVLVAIRGERPPGTATCDLIGHWRSVTVDLSQPFGDRELIVLGESRDVFNGSTLAQPQWIPDGWQEGPEQAAGFGAGPSASWLRTWAPPHPEPQDGACTPGPSGFILFQGAASIVDAFPSQPGETVIDTFDVNGATATYSTDDHDVARLSWTLNNQGFILQSSPTCAGDDPPTVETMLRFARNLDT